MHATVRLDRRQPRDPRPSDALPDYARIVHLGVILPNYGAGASPESIRRTTALAEELGYDSVWATEHIIVGPEAVTTYGTVYEPLVTLAWLAGITERIGLGTSIVILPLHHPIELAKQVASLQQISGRMFRLGVGMGWHADEFAYMGVDFDGRGRRGDEALRLIKALWQGERSFTGATWSFEDATFSPLPDEMPEIWVGGSSEPALRRARQLGDVWHPSRGSDPEHVRQVKRRFPELRIVPRTSDQNAAAFLEAGADGVVASFGDENSMRDLARRYR
jgi:probable F420-dependent oxidoreductase